MKHTRSLSQSLLMFTFSLLFSSLFSIKAEAWGLHYLVTDGALSDLSAQIQTEPLESFLRTQGPEIEKLFDGYYDWLTERGSKRFIRQHYNVKEPTTQNFLKVARLNPDARFYLMKRVMPGVKPTGKIIRLALLSPYESEERHYSYIFEDVSSKSISARAILDSSSDEPDWWIDARLWNHPEYGYGQSPYGKSGENSGDAAFHSQFAHESWILQKLAPEVAEGMAVERLELMKRLAQLAFHSQHPYWGYRFTAWGIHYIQDLSQPYHSKAVPHAGLLFYLKFAISNQKDRMKKETTQLVINRHYLFEDFVKSFLQNGFLNPTELTRKLTHSLSSGPLVWSDLIGTPDIVQLFDRVTSDSASQSAELDHAVVKAYGPKMTEDPSYDVQKDPNYDSNEILKRAAFPEAQSLVREALKGLERTGIATRTFLKICGEGK